MQQIKFDDACSNEFQMISIGGSFVLLLVIGLICDRARLKYILKNGVFYGIGAGICNGAKNFTTLAIYLFLPLSTVSPIKTSLGMITAFLVSFFFYKEKYTLRQMIGVIFGTVAIVLLAI
jgi:drug/metabolite transporter (DMT)-like permease